MTVDQETEDDPAIIKFVHIKPMTGGIRMNMIAHGMYPTTQPTGSVRVRDCVAEARFNKIGVKPVQFCLERDSDGEEFFGMNMPYQQ